jgi:hypothetical protein
MGPNVRLVSRGVPWHPVAQTRYYTFTRRRIPKLIIQARNPFSSPLTRDLINYEQVQFATSIDFMAKIPRR